VFDDLIHPLSVEPEWFVVLAEDHDRTQTDGEQHS
jgi:hypothetical protein